MSPSPTGSSRRSSTNANTEKAHSSGAHTPTPANKSGTKKLKLRTFTVNQEQSSSDSNSKQTGTPQSLRTVQLPTDTLPRLPLVVAELDEYVSVLLGYKPPPIDNGVMTLQEYANAV